MVFCINLATGFVLKGYSLGDKRHNNVTILEPLMFGCAIWSTEVAKQTKLNDKTVCSHRGICYKKTDRHPGYHFTKKLATIAYNKHNNLVKL